MRSFRFRISLAIFLMLLLTLGGILTLQAGKSAAPTTAVSGSLPLLSANLVIGGFNQPTDIANAGDDRLFIVERDGLIRIINPDGSIRGTPFLDIRPLVQTNHSERGLLGLTFHPDFPLKPYFYVNYSGYFSATPDDGDTIVARYTVTSDPHIADPDSAVQILRIPQPARNHNGGDLNFGPDGYLYISSGDGGGAGDTFGVQGNGQNPDTLLGKILRIDVDQGTPYAIPADNPFVADAGTRDEIWALGLRNPWRFSFDRQTGDMFIADVGQGNWEEVNFQDAASPGGENYGWRCYEGLHAYNTNGCGPANSYISPFDDYQHANNGSDWGLSVTGGFVYRGSEFPDLQGYYLYADYVSSNFWLAWENGNSWSSAPVGTLSGFSNPSTFGEGCDGELYVASYNGGIYRLGSSAAVVSGSASPEGLDQFNFLPFTVNGYLSCSS